MHVFVGYGYNDRDKWIEAYVFPLLKACVDHRLCKRPSMGSPLNFAWSRKAARPPVGSDESNVKLRRTRHRAP